MKLFCDEVKNKRKSIRMRLQVDNKLQQVKTKDLNDLDNVDMFTNSLHGSKAFAAEQKIKELKTWITKINIQKLKISQAKIIKRSTFNMNLMKSEKYGLFPEEVERRSLAGERFKTIFNIHRLEKTHRLDEYESESILQRQKS